jgi:GT2 family glycosyltransferase
MLSAVAVNFNSSALMKDCIASLKRQAETDTEYILIDSGSAEKDALALKSIESDDTKTLLFKENIGYAASVNAGIKEAKGEFILISNPDVVYLPGCIKEMLGLLKKDKTIGAVGPRTWMDRERRFLLPPSEPLTPGIMLRDRLMESSSKFRSHIQRRWAKKALDYWKAEAPIKQDMLSGACIMTTRKTLDAVGGFDEKFPLYFEDTDWCLRAKKAGYSLYMAPDARIIHYYNQSAKQEDKESAGKFRYSMERYIEKHFWMRKRALELSLRLLPHKANASGGFKDIGESPLIAFEGESEKLILLSPLPSMIPSAGAFHSGREFKMPDELSNMLQKGRYFIKAFRLPGMELIGSWSFSRA